MLGRTDDFPHLPTVDDRTLENAVEVREAAIDLLEDATQSTNPLLLAHTVEALEQAPEAAEPIVLAALAHPNRGVRFAAAMTGTIT